MEKKYACGFDVDGNFLCAREYNAKDAVAKAQAVARLYMLNRKVKHIETCDIDVFALYKQGYTRSAEGKPVPPVKALADLYNE